MRRIQLWWRKPQAGVAVLAAMALLCGGTVTFAGSSSSETAPKFGSWGIDLSAMDKSVKPGDDFFMYVSGTWYRSAIIPPDRVSTGVSDDIEIRTENRLKGIIAALAAKPYDSLSTDKKKLRDLYDAYVDQKAIDAAGLTPAKSDLDFIAGLRTLDDVASAMGRSDLGLAGPLSLDIDADLKDSNRYVVTADQSGVADKSPVSTSRTTRRWRRYARLTRSTWRRC